MTLLQPRNLAGFARILFALVVVSAMSATTLDRLPVPRELSVPAFAPAEPLTGGATGRALSSPSFLAEMEEELDEEDPSLSSAALYGGHEIEAAFAAMAAWVPNLQRVAARLTTGPPLF